MDLGLLVFLLVLGSVIFDKRKKKQTPNQEGQEQQDSEDMTTAQGEPYDWSEPSQQSRPKPKAVTRQKQLKDTMSWEAMEEYYGIKMERKESSNTISKDELMLEAEQDKVATVSGQSERWSVGNKAEQAKETPILINRPKEDKNKRSILPPGGLKGGIVWSLILQPPKAKQQRTYRR